MKRSLAVFAILLSFTACGRPTVVLPTEPQTVQGTLFPAGISRTRRGTHELRLGDKILFYVESRKIDLRAFEQLDVSVTGMVEENTDPDAALVLVATDVQGLATGAEVPWEVPALGIRFSAPQAWSGVIENASVQFTLTGALSPILTVYKDTAEPVLPDAQPVVIQNMQAVRSVDEETGTQTIAIRRGKETVILLFTPKDIEPDLADQLRQQFLRVLRSIQPMAASSTASVRSASSTGVQGSVASGGSSAAAMYCGGTAGVLCPSGQYCAITDSTAKTGICKPLKR